MKQYRILTTQDSAVLGRYDFQGLEAALNEAAQQGWQVVASHQAGNTMKSTHAQIMIILERETN